MYPNYFLKSYLAMLDALHDLRNLTYLPSIQFIAQEMIFYKVHDAFIVIQVPTYLYRYISVYQVDNIRRCCNFDSMVFYRYRKTLYQFQYFKQFLEILICRNSVKGGYFKHVLFSYAVHMHDRHVY